MAGLKIRSQEDPIVMAMFEALGAKATPMNYSEVYSALETKIVDGAENDMTSYYTSGHYEVAPYYSLDKHTALGSLFCMSAKAWDSLSAEQQEQVMKAAYVIGFLSLILVPVSGLSLIGGVFCVLMLLGVSKKLSFRYAFVLSVPVLIVMGIIELCSASTPAGIAAIIIGLILSAAASFLCVRVLKWVINNDKLKYFGYYDFGVGALALIIGLFELILK